MAAHKHAAFIIAWAQGTAVQFRKPRESLWRDLDTAAMGYKPKWHNSYEYRVKPRDSRVDLGGGYYVTVSRTFVLVQGDSYNRIEKSAIEQLYARLTGASNSLRLSSNYTATFGSSNVATIGCRTVDAAKVAEVLRAMANA